MPMAARGTASSDPSVKMVCHSLLSTHKLSFSHEGTSDGCYPLIESKYTLLVNLIEIRRWHGLPNNIYLYNIYILLL